MFFDELTLTQSVNFGPTDTDDSFGPFTTRSVTSPMKISAGIGSGKFTIGFLNDPIVPFSVAINYFGQSDLSQISTIDINNVFLSEVTGSIQFILISGSAAISQEVPLVSGTITFLLFGIDLTRITGLSFIFHIISFTSIGNLLITGQFTSTSKPPPTITFPPNTFPCFLPNYFLQIL